ncbi:DUF3828 domain-containing protein [Salmonella enterica subsp. enterica]|nr:DUF3828 domain-containing protein [Salmonella enterica subsp. enterica]EAW9772790.1 DUF3828 domain-containing protein [Salmonella enterica]
MTNETLFLLLLISVSATAGDPGISLQPEKNALEFNRWYIDLFTNPKAEPLDSKEIEKYVSSDTLKKLRATSEQERKSGDELYDADFFLKAQDYMEDWPSNVTVISSEYDPVCLNVWVAFGKNAGSYRCRLHDRRK